MASIDVRKAGWALQWRLGGARTGARQTLTFSTVGAEAPDDVYDLMLAAKKLVESRGHDMTRDQLEVAVTGSPTVPAGTPIFSTWAATYIADRRAAGDAQSDTLDDYERALTRWAVPYLGAKLLTDITHDVVNEWYRWLSTRRSRGELLSTASRSKTRRTLHSCLGAAVPKWIPVNPAANPAGARRRAVDSDDEPFEPTFLTPAEVDLILQSCSPLIRDLVFVAVHTGMRLGELTVLRPCDVELAGADPHIKVRRALKSGQKIGRPKSRRSRRIVTISAELCRVLAARMENKRPEDLLFTSARGHMIRKANLYTRDWRPALADAQRCAEHPPPLPERKAPGPRRHWRFDEVSTCACRTRLHRTPRFHDLRHTHISTLLELGWDIKRIQERVGHATFSITMDTYGHLRPGGDGERLSRLDEVFRLPG